MTVKTHESVPSATVCSMHCAQHATALPIKTPTQISVEDAYQFDQDNGDILFTIELNGGNYGFENGMLRVHLLWTNSGSSDSFVTFCQFRRSYFQRIVSLNISKDFQLIDYSSNTAVSSDLLQSKFLATLKRIINNKTMCHTKEY